MNPEFRSISEQPDPFAHMGIARGASIFAAPEMQHANPEFGTRGGRTSENLGLNPFGRAEAIDDPLGLIGRDVARTVDPITPTVVQTVDIPGRPNPEAPQITVDKPNVEPPGRPDVAGRPQVTVTGRPDAVSPAVQVAEARTGISMTALAENLSGMFGVSLTAEQAAALASNPRILNELLQMMGVDPKAEAPMAELQRAPL